MTPRFCQLHLITGLFLLLSSLGLLAAQQELAAEDRQESGMAQRSKESNSEKQQELALFYLRKLSNARLNPLTEPRLQSYARQVSEQVEWLSELLQASAYLTVSKDTSSARYWKAMQVIAHPQTSEALTTQL